MNRVLAEIIARTKFIMYGNGATDAQVEQVTAFLAKADRSEKLSK